VTAILARGHDVTTPHLKQVSTRATFNCNTSTHQQCRHLQATRLHGGITVTTPILLKPILYPTPPILKAAMLLNHIHVILLKSILLSCKSLHSNWPILFNNITSILLKSIHHPKSNNLHNPSFTSTPYQSLRWQCFLDTHVILLKSIMPSSKSLHSKWPILFNNITSILLKTTSHFKSNDLHYSKILSNNITSILFKMADPFS